MRQSPKAHKYQAVGFDNLVGKNLCDQVIYMCVYERERETSVLWNWQYFIEHSSHSEIMSNPHNTDMDLNDVMKSESEINGLWGTLQDLGNNYKSIEYC